ncbi:MAG: hypothetical protein WCK01_03140 [Candidatus Uhrbacteria bacterium]
MTLTAFVFSACGETRVEIIHEVAGCESDLDCNDHDETSVDSCEFGSGICNHERLVVVGCESFADCDDGDAVSVDTCVDAVCNHSRDITAPFDPASPERQDVVSLCEQPLSCSQGEGPLAALSFNRCSGSRENWNEPGYMMGISMLNMGTAARQVRIQPQLRVGDPTDLFRVMVHANDYRTAPLLVRDMTASELEREGLTFEYVAPTIVGTGGYVFLTINFAQPDTYRSRTLQWALPPDGVTDIGSSESLSHCLQVGEFMDVPEHGLLRLTQTLGTEIPQCTGTVRRVDSAAAGAILPNGLFRTVSDARIYFADVYSPTPRLYQFETLREFIDWGSLYGAFWHPNRVCAVVTVYEDIVLANALVEFDVETVGVRPGTPVTWYDSISHLTHYGFADQGWVIRDIGTDLYATTISGYACSRYSSIPSLGLGFMDYGCALDLGYLVSRYTTIPTDPMSLNPQAMSDAGWFAQYNHSP